jgi:type II restriction enzyme
MNPLVEAFFQTLTPDILAPKDYTAWQPIRDKVRDLRREIGLIQMLDKENALEDLSDLLQKHPKILQVLKLLIAHTPDRVFFDQPGRMIDFRADEGRVARDSDRATEIAGIFIEMGLVDFLKEVRSVEDMVKGVLIGLEPNSRKNRRGTRLEVEIRSLISTTVEKINVEKSLGLSFESQAYIELKAERKKVDYVVFQKGVPKAAVEVNFYSTSGSKPSEVLGRAYPEVQESLRAKGLAFVVITDGAGWESMHPVINTAFAKLRFLMNIRQARGGLLEKAILETLGV